ncbi:MAG: transcriptional regulator NrdR [Sphaerochaetaceae bacterium]|jgi:transcriptional repressor NrdR|nr:transcriptional regulator NrdR [Sphaerochaetaceae bacterium]MDD3164036.1 transcriptional regulator NrdR [Sphaerochaetaceae bacterium]MDD4007299.1 transcriptional regulator NrdR [Sphaerochaetaceae bacterium]MDD4397729.1 transcriptional regulator NrdR [Sphaerochaetaceae bacterium]
MKCPECGSLNDRVIESRPSTDGTSIRRRRECLDCGARFTSYEKVEEKTLMVQKRDKSYEPFDIRKLERGIRICTDKRQIDPEVVEELVHSIEQSIIKEAGSKRIITSSAIGEEALKELYKVDPVAYVRFASVYRSFSDVKQFVQEIEKIAQVVDSDKQN